MVKELKKDNQNLQKLNKQLKAEVKDLKKSVYIRENFIELLTG